MATRLVLIRHGVTSWNLARRWQGHAPVPLDERGHQQVQHLANALAKDSMVDAIYCSDLLRCRQTAEPVGQALGLPVILDERLRELDLGVWQGLTRQEMQANDGERYAQWQAGPNNYNWKGGHEPYYGPNWKSQRRNARHRDNYTCQRCGITEEKLSRQLDVHHLTPFREFGLERYKEANTLKNLVCLCSECHHIVENGGVGNDHQSNRNRV